MFVSSAVDRCKLQTEEAALEKVIIIIIIIEIIVIIIISPSQSHGLQFQLKVQLTDLISERLGMVSNPSVN